MSADNKKLRVPKLGQLGIVVRDLNRTMEYYRDVFGIGPWAVFQGEPATCTDRGRDIRYRGMMALAQAGGVEIELIEILEGDTLHTDFLKERGEGIHHIGFLVNDFDERMRAVEEAGIEVLQRGVLKQLGIRCDYAYLDTTEIGGVIIEFIQWRMFGMPVPLRPLVLRLGARIAARLGIGR